MPITVTVTAATIAEAQQELIRFFEVGSSTAAPESAGATGEEKRKPGRPKKDAAEAPTVEPAKPAAPAPVDPFATGPATSAAPPSYTLDDVKAALMKLAAKRPGEKDEQPGWGRVTQLLGQFGFAKVKDIPAEKFGLIMDAVAKAQASAEVAA